MASPRLPVEAPPFTPLQYGLLSVATLVEPTSRHWQNGVLYEQHCGMGGSTYDECLSLMPNGAGGVQTPPDPQSKTETADRDIRGALPFSVYAEYTCSPVDESDQLQIATAELQRSEGFQVEQAFWTGVAGGQTVVLPHLAADAEVRDNDNTLLQSSATEVSASVEDIVAGLGLLEAQLASCYGGQGVIHVPSEALTSLVAQRLVQRTGSQLLTTAGNFVAVGSGYAGTAPDGTAPAAGTTWLYATSGVVYYRGAVRSLPAVADTLDKATNTVIKIAERTYVLTFQCCHAAVNVELGTSAGS